MASSRDGVAASWFRNLEEGKCGKDRDFEFSNEISDVEFTFFS
jgi:hypothetical protein